MKKQITISGVAHTVATVEELRALDLTIAQAVEVFNAIPGVVEVKKFSDKNAAAKRLFNALPEYVEPKATPIKAAPKAAAKKTAPAAKPTTKPASTRPDGVKATLRKLYSDPTAAYTGAELEALTNASYKVLHDDLARLKHPTYAGKAGTLTLVRVGTLYVLEGSAKHHELDAAAPIAAAGDL